MRASELEMPKKDVEVLCEVVSQDAGRGVTAGEVKENTGWAEENYHVTYRFNNLEERGLVETEQVPERGKSNQIAPRVAWPTDEGVSLAEEVEFEPAEKPAGERLEQLEKQVASMRSTYGEVKERIVGLEEDLEELDGDVEDVAEDVSDLRRAVGQLPMFSADEEEFEFADGD
jgi:predicted transcriptional regulator